MRIRSIEAEDWLCKVPSQKGNEIQQTKLRHCSYITQSKLQHILSGQMSEQGEIEFGEWSSVWVHTKCLVKIWFSQS